DIVDDYGVWPDRDLSGIWQMQIHELDLVVPHFTQKVLENLDRELLAGAAPIAEAERGEPGIVADRQWLAVGYAEDSAEPAIGQARLSPIGDIECGNVKGASGKTDLLALGLVDLGARRHVVVAIGIELLRIAPVTGIEAGRGMRSGDIGVSLETRSQCCKGRFPVSRSPRILYRRDASAIRRYCAEQLHHDQLERGVRRAGCVIIVAVHRLCERCAHLRVAAVLAQTRHDAEDRVAPLAEGHKIMEAFENDVFIAEMLSVPGILEPIPGE